MAVPAKASFQQMQQQGDRWRRLTPAAQQELHTAAESEAGYNHNNKLLCSGCGKSAQQLHVWGACREAQYCR